MVIFKIGDVVRVKSNLKEDQRIDDCYFNPLMGKYKGKVFKITENQQPNRYKLDIPYRGDELHWEWSAGMLELTNEIIEVW
jgi:hypothetical protein